MHNPIRQSASDLLLFRARLLLEEGQSKKALEILEAMQTDDEKQQREKAYFLGWCYVLNQRWEDAMRMLLPLSHYEEGEEQGEPLERAQRERRARCLLHLGYAAINLSHFEEAGQHLTACLNVLRHKQLQRSDLQLLRIQARYSLALTYNMRGLYPAAIQHYEEALRLFLYVDNDDELAHIYYGVCDTYRKGGQLREAQLAGEKALHLYERTENHPLEGRMHNQLGNIAFLLGHFKKAADHYTEALAIAVSSGGVQMAMLNCAALAELRLAEGRLEEAKRYSQRAQELSQRSQNSFLCGQTYLVVGKVTFAEARETEDTHKRERLEEAIEQFKIAHTHLSLTEAYDELAETFVCWAQAAEALGRAEEALHLWQSAYQTLANVKGFG